MKNATRHAIGIAIIILIALVSWSLVDTLEKEKYHNLGIEEYKKGNYDTAIEYFTKAIESDQDNPHIYNDRGLSYLEAGDEDKAISDFCKAMELKPDFAEAYYNRGLAYFRQGGWGNTGPFEEAIADYTMAIELKSYYIDAYYNRGLAYNQLFHYYSKPFSSEINETYNKALADFDTALALDPMYVLAYAGKGNAYYRYGEFDKATEEYNKALKSTDLIIQKSGDKGLAGVYASRARNYKQEEEFDKSILDYNMALELDPKLMTALSHQASNYQIIEEYNNTKALELYDAQIDLIENDPDYKDYQWGYYAYRGRGVCCYEIGEYDNAIADFRTLIDKYESEFEPLAHQYLGMIFTERGDEVMATQNFEKAVELYSEQIESKPGSFEIYNERGLCYLGLEEYDSAISDFEKVIDLEPNYVDVHSGKNFYIEAYKNLGIVYSETGDKEKAREYLEEGLRLANE